MDYIETKHVAAELKRRLQNAFPGVKFSVRKGTGTACAWISVYWTDGPSTADVQEFTRPMQGMAFSGQEDRYEPTHNTVTVTVNGRKATGKPLVDGINIHQDVSADALKAAAALWSSAHDGAAPANDIWSDACVIEGHTIRENGAPQQVAQIAYDVVLPQRWTAAQEHTARPAVAASTPKQREESGQGPTLTHTAEEGTTVTGTRRGDGAAAVLKRHGFTWHRQNQYWYVPGSRDSEADNAFMTAVAADLTAASLTVTTSHEPPSQPFEEDSAEAETDTGDSARTASTGMTGTAHPGATDEEAPEAATFGHDSPDEQHPDVSRAGHADSDRMLLRIDSVLHEGAVTDDPGVSRDAIRSVPLAEPTEVIHRYTRARALADGVLVAVDTDLAKEAGFRVPVALTSAVWEDCVAWSDEDSAQQVPQDERGRLWDVLFMSRAAIRRSGGGGDRVTVDLRRVPRNGRARHARGVQLVFAIGPGDHDGEPVATIMQPDED